jgi:hypothetical protein
MNNLLDDLPADVRQRHERGIQLKQPAEGLAIPALLSQRHTRDAAAPQIVAADRSQRIGHRQRRHVGAQECRDIMSVQTCRVDLDDLSEPAVVGACTRRDVRRPAQRAEQHVAFAWRRVAWPDRQRADPLQFGQRDMGGPRLVLWRLEGRKPPADPGVESRQPFDHPGQVGRAGPGMRSDVAGGEHVRVAVEQIKARHRAGDRRVGGAEQPLPGGELKRNVRRVTEP